MITLSFRVALVITLSIVSISTGVAMPNDWNHGSTKSYNKDGKITLDMPEKAREGDLLVLFLSRTEDMLPLRLKDWKYAASCFKSTNGQNRCWTRKDCLKKKTKYCTEFPRGKGRDLATIVFVKRWCGNDPVTFDFDLPGNHKGWGFLLAVNGM